MSLEVAGSRRANINGAELEYWDIGSGPAVVFIHGGMGDECAAVLEESALTTRFRLIHFQRRGYGASTCPEMPVTIPQHSRDCKALLDHLGVQLAHVVGQSYGGAVSLQLAVDAPATVHSLTFLEPALASALLAFPEFSKLLERAVELYASGHSRQAIEQFARAVVGADRWDSFAAAGWLERWVPDAAVLFESDIPSFSQWEFGKADATRISQPVLNLRGADTPAPFVEVSRIVNEWLPHAEGHVVQQASHCMMQLNPSRVAELLVDFFDQYAAKQ